ncbi:MAG TPA: hypothetical protein VLB73_04230 [Patescibacteria group bacterium]|nr:hypothetical protein [Patescibacteria group bacterium]
MTQREQLPRRIPGLTLAGTLRVYDGAHDPNGGVTAIETIPIGQTIHTRGLYVHDTGSQISASHNILGLSPIVARHGESEVLVSNRNGVKITIQAD